MEYEFVLKKNGKEICREKGNEELKRVAEKIDAVIVKQK